MGGWVDGWVGGGWVVAVVGVSQMSHTGEWRRFKRLLK